MAENESVSSSLIAVTNFPDPGVVAMTVAIDGENESIIVYRDGNTLVAYLNVCPHAGRQLDYAPGKFLFENGQLVCAAHGATFRLRDGLCVVGPCRGQSLKAVAVRVEQDTVQAVRTGEAG